jgi:ABC transport system ATP-binding/permease protein
MFDKMFILDTGGYPVYYGNPGESLIYFKQLDAQINSEQGECPTCGNLNPELIFNILDASVIDEYGNYTNKRKITPVEWHEYYKKENSIPVVKSITSQPPKSLNIPSWFNQFKIYTLRDFFAKVSNKQYILLNLLEAPLLGFILAYLIRYISDPTSRVYIFRENENIPPYIFMGIVVALFFGLIISAEEIFKDAKILKRESFLKLSRSSYLSSKILLLFTISAIQMVLFVFVGNWVLGINNMYFEFWLALFSIAAFANILGLILSASFNSIVTIYILIPLVMIPQMVLGGAMFTFDKLNKDFTSVDKVPAIAEFMPSRYVYEALIVQQYKHNSFKTNLFETERQESLSDFKQVHYIPELREILNACMVHVLEDMDRTDRRFVNDLELLRNEFAKETRRVPDIKFEHFESLTPSQFTANTGNSADRYLNDLLVFYRTMFTRANSLKDQFISVNLNADPERFNRIKDDHYNESISSIVRREFEKNKIVRQGNHLVQMADPIYQIPEPANLWSFRTHFFAPMKHFGGKFFETLWFNITLVWILTILLYVVLYFDLLTKAMNFVGSIKWRKK